MALDHYHPVSNSEVYLLTQSHPHAPSNPPPSPPSPASPCGRSLSPPPEDCLPISRPESQDDTSAYAKQLTTALHVLSTEAEAVSNLTRFYETDAAARANFNAAISTIMRFNCKKGKLILVGVGKSGYICTKLVATLKSLSIPAEFMNPNEALHGDLGTARENVEENTILMITFSGATPELLQLLPHLDTRTPLIVMSRHTVASNCAISKIRTDAILLPTPILITETESFGFNAPTTSTTMCLALGDALAVVIAKELHSDVNTVFSRNHPGGAIGAANSTPQKILDLAIPLHQIPDVPAMTVGGKVLMFAYNSESKWLRRGTEFVIPPRQIKQLSTEDFETVIEGIPGLLIPHADWIQLPSSLHISQAQKLIKTMRESGARSYSDDGIVAVVDWDEILGFIEVRELMNGTEK